MRVAAGTPGAGVAVGGAAGSRTAGRAEPWTEDREQEPEALCIRREGLRPRRAGSVRGTGKGEENGPPAPSTWLFFVSFESVQAF